MSEYEKLMLLREAMAYYGPGLKEAYNFCVEHLYTNGQHVKLYTLELAYKLAGQYKASFSSMPNREWLDEGIFEVIDFIKDNEEGEKNV